MPRTSALPAFPTLVILFLAGCSSVGEVREETETTPESPTAVLEVRLVDNGIKGPAPFEATTKTWTRANMQREEITMKGAGTLTRFIGGATDSARISRLDRRLLWRLDPKEKSYAECPLKGCADAVTARLPEKKPEAPSRDPACRLKIAGSSFTVKQTGEKKAINGFYAELYQVAWLVTLADPAGRKATSTLALNVWTTQSKPPVKDAMALEAAYVKNLSSVLASTKSGRQKATVVPEDAQRMIEGFMAPSLTPADRAAFLKAGKEADKIKGDPVLTELAWNLAGEACAGRAEASGSSPAPLNVAAWLARKKTDEAGTETADAALLSFTTEVMSHRVESIGDPVFSPPRDYKRANPDERTVGTP
jgi:hypothetical protein